MDSDCFVLRQIDDLFEREEISAVSDAGWPDCFNSGLFVYCPSKETFRKLMKYASEKEASFDGLFNFLFFVYLLSFLKKKIYIYILNLRW